MNFFVAEGIIISLQAVPDPAVTKRVSGVSLVNLKDMVDVEVLQNFLEVIAVWGIEGVLAANLASLGSGDTLVEIDGVDHLPVLDLLEHFIILGGTRGVLGNFVLHLLYLLKI